MIKTALLTLLSLSLISCLALDEQRDGAQNSELGKRNIQYYADKTVSSLEIPPDLTNPDSQNAFKLSEYVANIKENMISFSKDDTIDKKVASVIGGSAEVQVKRIGQIRWLVVDKKPEVVWDLAESFFKSYGFVIKRSDKRIGIMETDFLENRPEIPNQSLGFIRSLLKKALSARYTLPIVDKYKIRIEPIEDESKTEVHFTLSSMQEVITKEGGEDENTIWQARPKDQSLETEMLYRFMLYLGSDDEVAKEQIVKEQQAIEIELLSGISGYAKLKFALDKPKTWEMIDWALNELNIDVEDKDVKEGSFYIHAVKDKDKGVFSKLLGDGVAKKAYQIIVKQIDSNTSEVAFNDLSEENEQATIDFSHQLLGEIVKKFQ